MKNLKVKNRYCLKFFWGIVNRIRHISIFKRLIISFFIVIIIPNFIIGYVTFNKYSKEFDVNMSRYMYNIINNVNDNINDKLKKYDEFAYKIYSDESISKLLKEISLFEMVKDFMPEKFENCESYRNRINEKLYSISLNNTYVENVEILTEHGEYFQKNSNNEVRGARIKDVNRFRESANYKMVLEAGGYPIWFDTSGEKDVYYRQINPEYNLYDYITLMRALPDQGGGGNLGVIIVNINIKAFYDMYNPQETVNKGNLLILSEKGVICSLNENIYAPTLNSRTISEIYSLKRGTLIRKIDRKNCFIVFHDSSYTGWILADVIDRDKIIESAYEVRNIIIKISLICIIFALIISYVVTISISSPLNNIKRAMGMVDEKNIDVYYEDNVNDEIGVLGQKFNSMIIRIKNLIDRIYEVEVSKKELEIKRKNAELDALQMQINPHFLYNTLDFIRWEAMFEENGEGKVSRMISDFSNLLRLGTKKSGYFVTIQEEIDHVNAYLKVIGYKVNDSIKTKWVMEDDIPRLMIAKLTLQPLVENAVIHGLAKTGENKELTIKGYRSGNDVKIEVSDNGSGIDRPELDKINRRLLSPNSVCKNIGLRNVTDRIKLYFGEEYGLSIESEPGIGTKVTVTIPYIQNQRIQNTF